MLTNKARVGTELGLKLEYSNDANTTQTRSEETNGQTFCKLPGPNKDDRKPL